MAAAHHLHSKNEEILKSMKAIIIITLFLSFIVLVNNLSLYRERTKNPKRLITCAAFCAARSSSLKDSTWRSALEALWDRIKQNDKTRQGSCHHRITNTKEASILMLLDAIHYQTFFFNKRSLHCTWFALSTSASRISISVDLCH